MQRTLVLLGRRPISRIERKIRENDRSLLFQSREDQRRLFFLSEGRLGREEVKSQVDLGKRKWGFNGASGGTHVSGVIRNRDMSVTEAMAIEAMESFLRNVSISFSIMKVSEAGFDGLFIYS